MKTKMIAPSAVAKRRMKPKPWSGEALGWGTGPAEGRYDRRFTAWAEHQGHRCIRTVDLLWGLSFKGGFASFSVGVLRQIWEERRHRRQLFLANEKHYVRGIGGHPGRRDVLGWRAMRVPESADDSQVWADPPFRSRREFREWVDDWDPDPGPWRSYYREQKAYFDKKSRHYEGVMTFWRACSSTAGRGFLRARSLGREKQWTAYPDYFLVFRGGTGISLRYGFVEVKGPRESLRRSQKRFFPEIVAKVHVPVWVARFTMTGKEIKFAEFDTQGKVRRCAMPCWANS